MTITNGQVRLRFIMTNATFKIAVNPRSAGAEGDTGERTGLTDGVFTIHKDGSCYTLSHKASGYMVTSRKLLADAKTAATDLRALNVNWSLASPCHDVDAETRQKIKAITQNI